MLGAPLNCVTFSLRISSSACRIAPVPPGVATEAARRTLMALGKKAASDILNTNLAPFLAHKPQMTLVRGG